MPCCMAEIYEWCIDLPDDYKDVYKDEEGKEYFFNYRWTLKEFLTRGLDRFLDSNLPFENFLLDKEGKLHKEVFPKYEEKK